MCQEKNEEEDSTAFEDCIAASIRGLEYYIKKS